MVTGFAQIVSQDAALQEQAQLPQDAGKASTGSLGDGVNDLREVELIRLRDVFEGRDTPHVIKARQEADEQLRYQNIHGTMPGITGYEVALAVVEALGAESKSGECLKIDA